MNLGDLHKVWETKALKKKPREDEAKKILERIAKQVQPIMHKRQWRVKLLCEMCPKNARLLGLNVGCGVNIKLRLRFPNREHDFYPYDQVLDTMLHELCHNVHGPHDAKFYKLWDELRKECEELMSRGITGTGQGFDLPGRRLGGFTRQPPLSSLRETARLAAEKRAVLGSLLPPGPRRLGGDNTIMAALSPVQAAAMAAERRLQDDIWCGSLSCEDSTDHESGPDVLQDVMNVIESSKLSEVGSSIQASGSTSKRSWEKRDTPTSHSSTCSLKSTFVDSTASTPASNKKRKLESDDFWHSLSRICTDSASSPILHVSPSESRHNPDAPHDSEESLMWDCSSCTLLNPPLAPICKLCGAQRPKHTGASYNFWSCKFCTLDNSVKLDRCSACQRWRYSNGPPVSATAPHRGD